MKPENENNSLFGYNPFSLGHSHVSPLFIEQSPVQLKATYLKLIKHSFGTRFNEMCRKCFSRVIVRSLHTHILVF